jgi:hypothetical protein
MATREAVCSCGQLKALVEGDPLRVSVCHCLACQRRTGSVFGVQSRFPRERVSIHGRSSEFVRASDDKEERTARFHFCPDCGATVYFLVDSTPEMVAIPVGAFADPSFPPPSVSVWEDRGHRWVVMPGGVEHIA